MADLKTNYTYCKVSVYDFASENIIGFIEVNLGEWTKLFDSKSSKEELDKHIIKSTFV